MSSPVACEISTRAVASADDLAEVVASLGDGGATAVVVGVVGPGVGRVRGIVGDVASVYALSVPDTSELEAAGAKVFPVPGRCVLIVREHDAGWDLAVAVPPTVDSWTTEVLPAASVVQHPRHPVGLNGGAFARTLLGEVAGAGLGFGAGLGLSRGCNYSNCDLGFAIVGACAGSWTGSVIAGATIDPHVRPAAGALAGSAASLGLLLASAASAEGDSLTGSVLLVSLALMAPPLGAGIAVGSWGDGPAATVSWRW